MKRFVLDASAVLAYLADQQGANEVEELLRRAVESDAAVSVPLSAWSSVCAAVWRQKGRKEGQHVLQQFCQLPLTFVELDRQGAAKAAELAAESEIPILPALSAAVASLRKATLVTADSCLSKLDKLIRVQQIGIPERGKSQ
jgi:predicted nucleic acid-binding protein